MLKLYPNEVKLVFKNFQLQSHKFAKPAAIAALAAGKQGKFWEMHDAIFENYNKLNDAIINELAQQIGLDMGKYETDKKNPLLKNQVERDFQIGRAAGVRGTPTLFVNGRKLKNRSVDGFRQLIDKELSKLKGEAPPYK